MMKPEDIKVKMDAAYDRYQKRLATTKKFEDRAAKNLDIIKKNGWDKYVDASGNLNAYTAYDETHDEKIRDTIWAYDDAIYNAKESAKKEPEELQKYEGWVKKYNMAIKFAEDADAMPQVFKDVIDLLAKEWTEWDIQERERMLKWQSELPRYNYKMTKEERDEYDRVHRKFEKAFPYSRRDYLTRGDDYIYNANKDTATTYVKDLIHRIKDRVGEITNMEDVHFAGKALNGVVEGTMGKVRLETILAGGYNIQRLHYRVILHNEK